MKILDFPIRWANRVRWYVGRNNGLSDDIQKSTNGKKPKQINKPKGTYVTKNTPARLKREIGAEIPVDILVWRSVSVRFLRALIHPRLGGRWFLRILYWLEEHFPHFFGENGQYPLIVLRKPYNVADGLE